MIEHGIKSNWKSFTDVQKGELKTLGLELIAHTQHLLCEMPYIKVWVVAFTSNGKSNKKFVQEKVVAIVVDLAKREWPQNWPSLLESLFELGKVGESHVLRFFSSSAPNVSQHLILLRSSS